MIDLRSILFVSFLLFSEPHRNEYENTTVRISDSSPVNEACVVLVGSVSATTQLEEEDEGLMRLKLSFQVLEAFKV